MATSKRNGDEMKQINSFFEKVNKPLRPVVVFLLILSSAAPLGKIVGYWIYYYLLKEICPVTMYEQAFVLIPAVLLAIAATGFYMDTIYNILKKHFQTV